MVQTIKARDISLYELEEKFCLELITDTSFFTEWQENLPSLTDEEKTSLEQVKSNYLNLTKRRPMSKEAVHILSVLKRFSELILSN
jgi:hypothetical protein